MDKSIFWRRLLWTVVDNWRELGRNARLWGFQIWRSARSVIGGPMALLHDAACVHDSEVEWDVSSIYIYIYMYMYIKSSTFLPNQRWMTDRSRQPCWKPVSSDRKSPAPAGKTTGKSQPAGISKGSGKHWKNPWPLKMSHDFTWKMVEFHLPKFPLNEVSGNVLWHNHLKNRCDKMVLMVVTVVVVVIKK